MKTYIPYSLILILFILATSCEKVIDIQVDDDIGKLVIEGTINNTEAQQEIKLSKNIAFSDHNNYPAVSGAIVIVRDDEKNEYLFSETTAGTYMSKAFTGIPGKSYSFEVRLDENKYTAISQMPQVVTLDSIAAEKPKFGEKDTRNIKVFYQDPKDQINQYRFVLFVNDKQIKDIYAVNDDFNNGNQVSVTLRPDEDVDIISGDKIRVEMIGIDKNIYQYWYSLMQQSAGAGITPSNPPTNISPSVFGYFSAQTTSSKQIQVD
jgi:hypothetical protein